MPLTCQFVVGTPALADGQAAPVETLSLTVLNPGTSSVSVTGYDLQFSDRALNPPAPSRPPLPPITQGQQLTVGPGATVTFGPFPLSSWTSATLSSLPLITPAQPSGAEPGTAVFVGGVVYASDGSANVAGAARILLSPKGALARAFVGGIADFTDNSNSNLIGAVP